MNARPGFTLIELVVTIAIAGILLALAIPSFRETTLNNQRASRTNQLVTALNYARGQALALRTNVEICRTKDSAAEPPVCDTGTGGWEDGWVVFADNNGDGEPSAGETLRRQDALLPSSQASLADSAKFTMRGNNNVSDSITFATTGMSPGSVGTIVACDSRNDFKKGRAVVVARTGRILSFDTYTKNGSGSRDPRLSPGVTTCER
ncbi:GspH/FimT family pseudopilin [Panacagrimonas sp.]|uniref:GspH/FimT family pseudopilin n=1 Tax=Panacagrimonas sp. TaxID=2480088 RepID=UPI003B522FC6